MWSDVQQRGGMWAGSETDMVNILLRHEWHMRWLHESLAEREMGTSSEPHVRQEVFFSGGGARGVMKDENMEEPFLWVSMLTIVLAMLTSVPARAAEVGVRCRDGRDLSLTVVALFRKGGRALSGGYDLLRTVSIRYSMTCPVHTCPEYCAHQFQKSCASSQALSFSWGQCASLRCAW